MDGAKLRAKIQTEPDDDDLRLVYGDLLQQEGKAQGELIALQATLREKAEDADLNVRGANPAGPPDTLLARELSHRTALTRALLAGVPEGGVELGWHLGFIASVRIRAKVWGASRPVIEKRVLGFVDRVLSHECAVLRSVHIDANIDFAQQLVLARLLLARPPLHSLGLGAPDKPLDADLSPLSAFALRELSLAGTGLRLDDLDLPRLESLSLEARGSAKEGVALLDHVAPILARTAFRKLSRLAIRTAAGPELVRRLVLSPLLAHLEELGVDNSDETMEALLHHQKAIAHVRLPPGAEWSPTKLHNWGVFLGEMNRPLEELVVNERAILLQPDPDTMCNQGKTLGNLDREDEALVLYDRVIREFPAHAEAWYLKGCVFRERQELESALRCFEEASRMTGGWGSEDPATWANIGYMQRLLGNDGPSRAGLERAATLYAAHIAANPDDDDAVYWKASTHALLGDRTTMLEDLTRAVKLDGARGPLARKEPDFEAFWKDRDFQRITAGKKA